MKNKIELCAIAVVILLLNSCKKEKDNHSYQVEDVKWLLGRWENNSRAGNLSEIWTQENDSVYHAQSYFAVGNDTVFAEHVVLREVGGKLVYEVTVPTQNSGKPVAFTATTLHGKQIQFENLNHDYPNRILYYTPVKDSLIAKISGIKEGNTFSETFAMQRSR